MRQVRDSRLNILVHPDASQADLPVEGLPELPGVPDTEPFVAQSMDEPRIYPGDVIVGIDDGEIVFAELVYEKVDGGVLVLSLQSGHHNLIPEGEFSSRFYKTNEVHIYDGVVDEAPGWDPEFDESQVQRPEQGRPR